LHHSTLVDFLRDESGHLAKGHTQEMLLNHISRSFDIHEDDSLETIYNRVHKSLVVEEEIPGLNDPESRLLCELCNSWVYPGRFAKHNTDQKHNRNNQGTSYYTIPLFNQRNLQSFRVRLQNGWKPCGKAPAIPSALISPPLPLPSQNASAPAYIQNIGYLDYIDSLNLQRPTELMALVEPPSPQMVCKYAAETLPWKLEKVLLLVRKQAKYYILEADKRVTSAHPSVMKRVTYG
jgi:hypothetical protein